MTNGVNNDIPIRYFLYIRKSTEDNNRQVLSHEAQEHEGLEMAQRHGIKDVITLPHESRTAKMPGRPVFCDMVERIKCGEAQGIITWAPNRISRNPLDAGEILHLVREGKIKDIICHNYRLDRSPSGMWMLGSLLGISQLENDTLSQSVKRGIRAKLRSGWLPGRAPLGYLNDTSFANGVKHKTIASDPDRFPVIRRMWDYLLTGGYTVADIHRLARDEWGLRTIQRARAGGRPLVLSAVYQLFQNPFYAGMIRRKGELYQGAHTPMVSMLEFEKAQRLLGNGNRQRPRKAPFALTGLFRCGSCGCSVTAETHVKKSGRTYIYYRCTKKRGPCPEPYVPAVVVTSSTQAFVASIAPKDQFLSFCLKWMAVEAQKSREVEAAIHKTKETSLKRTESDLQRLLQLCVRGVLNDDEYLREKNRLIAEQHRLKEELAAMTERGQSTLELTRDALFFANTANNRFATLDYAEKRATLKTLGSNFVIKDRKVLIQAKKPFSLLARRASISVWSGIVNDVRTHFIETGESIVFPAWFAK